MGLLQDTFRLYENVQEEYAGVYSSVMKTPLCPVFHDMSDASLDIILDPDGNCIDMQLLHKGDGTATIFPITEESQSRTNDSYPHPLCDFLKRVRTDSYLEQLKRWANSAYSHALVRAVVSYIESGSLDQDLLKFDVTIDVDSAEDKDGAEKQNSKAEELFVRWTVIGIADGYEECWKNRNLHQLWIDYYTSLLAGKDTLPCMLTGEEDVCARTHPKKLIHAAPNAKLVSSKDDDGFKYRGYFPNPNEALSIGISASQKSHLALRWLVDNYGINDRDGSIIAWNIDHKPVPAVLDPFFGDEEAHECYTVETYKNELWNALNGYRNNFTLSDRICFTELAVVDKKSGRLSILNHIDTPAEKYLQYLMEWDEHCCWWHYSKNTGRWSVQTPSLRLIVNYAFGVIPKNNSSDIYPTVTSDKQARKMLCSLIRCRVQNAKIPTVFVQKLMDKVRMLSIYKPHCQKELLYVTCAVLRKYYWDYYGMDLNMELNTACGDRSYVYGRMLALYEKIETSTYREGEYRTPSALRSIGSFMIDPERVCQVMERKSQTIYYPKMEHYGGFYRKELKNCRAVMNQGGNCMPSALTPMFLIGYSLERRFLYMPCQERCT